MADIFADDKFKCILMQMIVFQFKSHWNMSSESPIDNEPALVQVMAWRQRGNKPLPEPMLT